MTTDQPYGADGACSFCTPPMEELELASSESVRVAVLTGAEVPGWFVVHPHEHITSWAQISDQTGLALVRALRTVSRALIALTGDDRTYMYAMGERKPHLHVLVGSPRFVAVADVGRGAPVLDAVLFRTAVDVAASIDIAKALRPLLGTL
jgi:diadenosine tetraphosphate (Ap4A) HIT family hydrolase